MDTMSLFKDICEKYDINELMLNDSIKTNNERFILVNRYDEFINNFDKEIEKIPNSEMKDFFINNKDLFLQRDKYIKENKKEIDKKLKEIFKEYNINGTFTKYRYENKFFLKKIFPFSFIKDYDGFCRKINGILNDTYTIDENKVYLREIKK